MQAADFGCIAKTIAAAFRICPAKGLEEVFAAPEDEAAVGGIGRGVAEGVRQAGRDKKAVPRL